MHDEFIDLTAEERLIYEAVESYISSTYNNAAEEQRNAVGFVMTICGFGLGVAEVVLRIMGNAVSVGTVVLVALLLIFGSQFTLFAMWFDMESNKDLR